MRIKNNEKTKQKKRIELGYFARRLILACTVHTNIAWDRTSQKFILKNNNDMYNAVKSILYEKKQNH